MGVLFELAAAADGETVEPGSKELDQLHLLEQRSVQGEAEMEIEESN